MKISNSKQPYYILLHFEEWMELVDVHLFGFGQLGYGESVILLHDLKII